MEYTSEDLIKYLMPNATDEQSAWAVKTYEGFLKSSAFTVLSEKSGT
jgi:hypothetical protein